MIYLFSIKDFIHNIWTNTAHNIAINSTPVRTKSTCSCDISYEKNPTDNLCSCSLFNSVFFTCFNIESILILVSNN